jgi:hypothetical protein
MLTPIEHDSRQILKDMPLPDRVKADRYRCLRIFQQLLPVQYYRFWRFWRSLDATLTPERTAARDDQVHSFEVISHGTFW